MGREAAIRIPRGTVDLAGEALQRLEAVESAAREIFFRHGFEEFRGPFFEETRLFARAIGAGTDVVEKEMFSIPREGETYSLRPEGTASVVRYYIEHSLHGSAPFQKLCYIGPMFRYERPQAGRQRQFHQVGVEVLGAAGPLVDAEVILVQDRFFRQLGLAGQEVKINTIGSIEERPGVRKILLDALRPRVGELCEKCVGRMERNVFRVLDCKREGCREVARGLPPLPEIVGEESRSRFLAVREILGELGVVCRADPLLVRGLDYYTHTVFETVHPALGARDTICGGGRYDGLVKELGGPSVPACGFAVGVEPTLLALQKLDREPPQERRALDVTVVAVDESCRPAAFRMLTELRDAGVAGDMDLEVRSMKAQMKKAARSGCRFALILGPDEIAKGTVTLRRMETSEQEEISAAEVAARVRE